MPVGFLRGAGCLAGSQSSPLVTRGSVYVVESLSDGNMYVARRLPPSCLPCDEGRQEGDLLHAVPYLSVGTRLDDTSLRVTVSLVLGLRLVYLRA